MRYLILTLLSLCAVASLHAQEIVSLRSVPFYTKTPESIHIETVIDKRKVKSLGTQTNLNAEPIELLLHNGAEQTVKAFYDLTLRKDSLSQPIHIKIKALNIQESKRRMNDGIARVARAHISLTFLQEKDNTLKEIFSIKHNEDEVFDLDDKPGLYATHEKRIRAALEYCMHAFLEDYQKSRYLLANQDFKPEKKGKKIDVELGEWYNLITIKGMQSTYFEGYGVSYTGFVDSKKGLIRPYETSFEVTWAKPDVARDNGYAEVDSFVFRPELYFFYKRLLRGVYASMSANIPVGFETLEALDNSNSLNFVIGAGASQGLRFIPWKNKGLVFGADFFQQFENSKVYRFDLGLEVVLGINF